MKSLLLTIFIFTALLFFIGCPNSGTKPTTPEINGPIVVLPGVTDTFSAVSTDPDGDNIAYRFNWNGIITEWSDLIASGTIYKEAHTFINKGFYDVKVQAKDQSGKTSDWSDVITVVCGLGIPRWFFTCPDFGDFNSTPAVDDQGNIYVGCSEGHLHAVNSNGQARWQYASLNVDEFISSPVIAPNGNMYACDRGGKIYCLTTGGNLNWYYSTTDEIVATPAVGSNSEIYVNSADGYLYAINSAGQEMWHVPAGGASSAAVDANNNIYVGSTDNYLYSYTSSGTLRWKYDIGDEIISSPAIMPNGKICFGGQDGYFYILNPDSTLFNAENLIYSISSSPVIGTDSAIYFTSEDGHLVRLHSNGELDWAFSSDGYLCSSPAVVRNLSANSDIIYFKVSWAKFLRQDEDSLFMIKADGTRYAAGALPSSFSTDELVSSPIVNANGTIFIGGGINDDDFGGLFALTGQGAPANSCWPLFRRDRKNSGRVQ